MLNEKLLRAEEVAEILSISKAYAYKLMKSGEIPTVRMGRAVRVREQDLLIFITENVKSNAFKHVKPEIYEGENHEEYV